MKFAMGELFCGAGGLALGSKRAQIMAPGARTFSIEHVWANDFDEWACASYAHNIMNGCSDKVYGVPVQELKIEQLDRIDAFAFGFPCNDYSIVGKQKGLD
ncbi:MAG TPA: DNA cytosine methyltransferase, partial [Natronincola sp.]|nr:DNA cytosine methyltransferase [Natronincola sp.]